MKRIIAIALLAVMSLMCLASCGGNQDITSSTEGTSDLGFITEQGVLVVGITDFEPMDYKEDGSDEWTGFDAELARLVGNKLGVKVEFQEINWQKKESALKSSTFTLLSLWIPN